MKNIIKIIHFATITLASVNTYALDFTDSFRSDSCDNKIYEYSFSSRAYGENGILIKNNKFTLDANENTKKDNKLKEPKIDNKSNESQLSYRKPFGEDYELKTTTMGDKIILSIDRSDYDGWRENQSFTFKNDNGICTLERATEEDKSSFKIMYDTKTCDMLQGSAKELGISGVMDKCTQGFAKIEKKLALRSEEIRKEKNLKHHTKAQATFYNTLGILGHCAAREEYLKTQATFYNTLGILGHCAAREEYLKTQANAAKPSDSKPAEKATK